MAFFQADFMSKSLKQTVRFTAALPTDTLYPDEYLPALPLKTLYLLHGYSSNPVIWQTEVAICDMATQHGIAIIMPETGNNMYMDNLPRQDMYSNLIGRELIAYTRKIFPLSEKKEDTIIAGFSMGGYGSLYNGLKYNDTFGHIIAVSPAVLSPEFFEIQDTFAQIGVSPGYFDSLLTERGDLAVSEVNILWLIKKLKEENVQFPNIYHAVGDRDLMILGNRRLDALLTSLDIPHTYEEGLGMHDSEFFAKYIRKGIENIPFERPQELPRPFLREHD
jgi:S-formylglutathione hydrolase FrmB